MKSSYHKFEVAAKIKSTKYTRDVLKHAKFFRSVSAAVARKALHPVSIRKDQEPLEFIANPPFSSIDGPVFFTPPVIMFKLARSRPFAAAFKPSKVSDLQLKKNIVSTQPDANSYQVYSPSRLAGVAQQKRALSIHEYLSADLLRQVCESMLMGWIRSL